MRQITWPVAFVLVFGVLPAFAFTVAVAVTYPAQALPFFGGVAVFIAAERIGRRRAAVAARAALAYRHNAAIVVAPLPDMPTVPIRGTA